MTALPPDPEPGNGNIPALDEGGGVQPGDTPPDAAQTSGSAHKDPPIPGSAASGPATWLIVIGVFAAVFLCAAIFLVLRLAGAFG